MAKAQLAQTKVEAESHDIYGGADISVSDTLYAVEEAAIEAERLASAILLRLKGQRTQELGASDPDCDSIEAWLGAIHSKLKSINDDLRASADTLGA